MSYLGGSLYSPELKTSHPIVITPLLNGGDLRRTTVSTVPTTDEVEGLQPGSLRGDYTRTGVSAGESPEAYDISWPKIKGSVKYRLWGSMSPVGKGIILQDDIKRRTNRRQRLRKLHEEAKAFLEGKDEIA